MQKWPASLTKERHGQSRYNAVNLENIEGYKEFVAMFDEEYKKLTLMGEIMAGIFPSPELKRLANLIQIRVEVEHPEFLTSDEETPLTDYGHWQAEETGKHLPEVFHGRIPDVAIVSTHKRTRQTWEGNTRGWPELAKTRVIFDPRVREQEHGLRIGYADWRIYCVKFPEFVLLHKLQEFKNYRHQNGESVLDIEIRIRDVLDSIQRRYGGAPDTIPDMLYHEIKSLRGVTGRVLGGMLDIRGVVPRRVPQHVFMVSHHRTILVASSILERWDAETFQYNDRPENRPPNCSITRYVGVPGDFAHTQHGWNGYMKKEYANRVFWK